MAKTEKLSAQQIDSNTKRVIVCDTCHTVVAQDHDNPIDPPVVATLVRNHNWIKTSESTTKNQHELLTVDLKNKTCLPGVHLEKNFTD